MQQIVLRLFPFEKGLRHNYWVGNVWAICLFLEKVLRFLKINLIMSHEDITPAMTSILILLSFVPVLMLR